VPAPVPYANLANPQTLNLYAMVGDNPETFADLDGHLLPAPIAGTGTSPLLQGNENALEAAYAAAVAAAMDAAEVSASQAPQTPAQAQNLSWSSLSAAQRAVLAGGEKTWNGMDPTARANFGAITHALETTKLDNGATGLSEVKSASMKSDTEMKVTWQKGAKEAFEAHGFSGRTGEHLGTSLGPTGWGVTGLHLVFGRNFLLFHSESQVHIDYRGLGEGHFTRFNDDVTAPTGAGQRAGQVPINNYERYKAWYPW
jgi:hypothetical protein